MINRRKLGRAAASSVAVALVLATLNGLPVHASENSVAESVSTTSELALESLGHAESLDPFVNQSTGFVSDDGSVKVDEGEVSIDLGADTDMTLRLPVSSETVPETATDGSLIFASGVAGLSAVVQSVEGGAARILTVADETYAENDDHHYAYDVTLQDGVELSELSDGTVVLVQEAADALENLDKNALEAALAEALPSDDLELDNTEYAENTASLDVLGDPAVTVEEGKVIVGALQTPWAVDSKGVELPTTLNVEAGKLVQSVDTTNATFPVTADPFPLIAIGLGLAARALAPHVLRAFVGTAIRAGMAYTVRNGFTTFARFKGKFGNAKPGYQWHHIVEQATIKKKSWDPRAIHNPQNLIQIPTRVHQKCVNSWMARKNVNAFGIRSGGNTMRNHLHSLSFTQQHRIGVDLLKLCGVKL